MSGLAEMLKGYLGGDRAPPAEDYSTPLRPMIDPAARTRAVGGSPEFQGKVDETLRDAVREGVEPFKQVGRAISGRSDNPVPEGLAGGLGVAMAIPGGIAKGALKAGAKALGGEALEDILKPAAKLVQPAIWEAYHGSPQTGLSVIHANPATRQFDNATSQFGAFFAPTEGAAKRYAGGTGRVYKTDLDLKNPYEMPWSEFDAYQSPHKGANGENLFEGGENALKTRAEELKVQAAQHRKELEGLGHDGIIVRNSRGQPIEMASFKDVKVGGLEDMIKAYHGSPHDFERFDLSKIGTGEGAQAYGHGLYFAENPAIAKSYREKLAGGDIEKVRADEEALAAIKPKWDEIVGKLREARAKSNERPTEETMALQNHLDALNDHAIADTLARKPWLKEGRMYEVGIRANPEHFLDWDKPLSEQSQHVQNILGGKVSGNEPLGSVLGRAYNNPMHAGDILGKDRATHEELTAGLREAGIPGIKYLDQGSRDPAKMKELANDLAQYREAAKHWEATGNTEKLNIANKQIEVLSKRLQETRNYVVFDDKLIDILKKYGIAGIGALPAMNAFHYQDKTKQ